jgi:hypothetical protein
MLVVGGGGNGRRGDQRRGDGTSDRGFHISPLLAGGGSNSGFRLI